MDGMIRVPDESPTVRRTGGILLGARQAVPFVAGEDAAGLMKLMTASCKALSGRVLA